MEVMDKAGTEEFQKRLGRVEELIAALEAAPDVAVREQVRELIQTLLDLHGTGLERALERRLRLERRGLDGDRQIEP